MADEMIYMRDRGWVSLAEFQKHCQREETMDHLKLAGFMFLLTLVIVVILVWG